MNVLYVQASPRGESSHSVTTANALIKELRTRQPEARIDTLNVFTDPLPEFNADGVSGRYKLGRGLPATPEETAAWKNVVDVIERFKAADTYVFAIPMWNFGIPYRLKQYIDLVAHPTHTFAVEDGQYKGLVTGKPAVVVYSRGGEYPENTPAEAFDFQKRYFETFLGFIGFTDISSIVVEPTLAGGPEIGEQKRAAAIAKARELASRL